MYFSVFVYIYSEQLTAELERYRLRSAELQSELEKIKRQYQNEKIEREAAITELKRYDCSCPFYLSQSLHTCINTF